MKKEEKKRTERSFLYKLGKLFAMKRIDRKQRLEDKANGVVRFNEFGITMFCGEQGNGKTTSAVNWIEEMKMDYSNLYVMSNCGYINENEPIVSWQQLVDHKTPEGFCGSIFFIDEIQSEFPSTNRNAFPEQVLRVITQQRKGSVKVIATAQVYTRVAKPLREQTFEVVECNTYLRRFTRQRWYKANDYNDFLDSNQEKKYEKLKVIKKASLVQDEELRSLFDSFKLINALDKRGVS